MRATAASISSTAALVSKSTALSCSKNTAGVSATHLILDVFGYFD